MFCKSLNPFFFGVCKFFSEEEKKRKPVYDVWEVWVARLARLTWKTDREGEWVEFGGGFVREWDWERVCVCVWLRLNDRKPFRSFPPPTPFRHHPRTQTWLFIFALFIATHFPIHLSHSGPVWFRSVLRTYYTSFIIIVVVIVSAFDFLAFWRAELVVSLGVEEGRMSRFPFFIKGLKVGRFRNRDRYLTNRQPR